ncbi:MAG: CpaE family protein [Rhodoluna sp.]
MITTLRNRPGSHLTVVDQQPKATAMPGFPVSSVACFSGSGSPGRSTLAINLATEFALVGKRVLLIDLDTLAPSISLQLGLTDAPAGLSALLRLVEQNRLSRTEFARLTVRIDLGRNELTFVPGISSPVRWPEVSIERLTGLLESVKTQFDLVVFDLPQASYSRGRISHPSLVAEERDGLLSGILTGVSKIVFISGSDPVSAKRFIDAKAFLTDLHPSAETFVAVNRFRTTALGPAAKVELEQTYERLLSLRIDSFIPDEPENFDRAIRNGLPLALLKRSSPARAELRALANQILISSAKAQSG